MKTRGMGSVYQNGYRDETTGEKRLSATWSISYYVHGVRHKERTDSTNRADAMRLLKQRIGEAGLGRPVGNQIERTTLRELIGMVINDYTANGRRSAAHVEGAYRLHLIEFFGADRKAREITGDQVTGYKAHRLQQGAAPGTINLELAALRRGFRLAKRAGKVAALPEIPMLRVDNTRKGFFEREQYEAVLRHLPGYVRPIAQVAYVSGWRAHSELLSRQWRHVDFANGWLRLDPGESKNGEGRQFPFTDELRAVLEAQRDHVREIERATGQIVPWVFVHTDGSRIKDFRAAWANACKAAGVPGRLVHDFRRTAVRNLERAGVPRSAAMKLTGHKTEAVYRRYAIVDSAMLQEAAVKLSALHASEANSPSSVKVRAFPV